MGPDLFTFLFTDIEGSSRLIERLGDAAPAVIARHHAILRTAIERAGGAERRTEGDSFFATFGAPTAAVEAALAIQRDLVDEPWPVEDGVRVRIGVHTGEAFTVGHELVGLDVHRAARVMSVGWGGQILVSDATARLVRDQLTAVTLRDLGAHRLKDLAEPERIHQILAPGLRQDFPTLRSLDATRNNLPTQLTSFVGRDRELQEVVDLLDDTRLLTLSGPGGTGKTRLSLQVAAEVADRFPDGVFFVPLATVTDASLVASAIAGVLGLAHLGSQTPLELVTDHLHDARALLVLDNFEQILDAAPDVSKLLSEALDVTIIVSSRAPLRISGEQEYPVPPLSLPGPPSVTVEEVAASEAGVLFIRRARAVRPDFVLTEDNALPIAAVIRHLDGLPLAIELAASRVRLLPVEAIAARLGDVLDLLSAGGRDLTDRQRTLRGAISWSYDLLEPAARVLYARLSVFRGGASFDHIEAVCGPGLDGDTFAVLAELVDHSLVRRLGDGTEARFGMLETIREYAAECLGASGEAAELRERHAATFLAAVEQAAPHLTGPDGARWLDQLETDHDNLRAALRRSIEDGDVRTALRLVSSSWRLWQIRGHLHEGRRHVETVVGLPGVADHPAELMVACEAGGGICYWQGDLRAARILYTRALELARSLGDAPAEARSLYNLAFSYGIDDTARSLEVFGEALAAYETLGDELGVARTHWGLSVASMWNRDYEGVLEHAEQCIAVFREAGATFDLAWALHLRGMGAYAFGRYDEARRYYLDCLEMFLATSDASGFYLALADFALLAEAEEDDERALRLLGAVERLGEETGGGLLESQLELLPRPRYVEDEVDPATAARLKAEGRAMTRDEAIAYARQEG